MRLHPGWGGLGAAGGLGWAAGHAGGTGLGWTAFGLSGLVCWVVHSWYRPLSDCWWCGGNPKRRGRRLTGFSGLVAAGAGVAGWVASGSGVLALVAAAAMFAGSAMFAGTGKSFHMCWKPVWIGGCRATGRRKKILTVITGRGFSRI